MKRSEQDVLGGELSYVSPYLCICLTPENRQIYKHFGMEELSFLRLFQ